MHKHTRKKMLILFLDIGDAELLSYQIKHNGKPLHDRERLIRQILENIGHLDNVAIPGHLWAFMGIFAGFFLGGRGSLGIFGDLWGSLGIF